MPARKPPPRRRRGPRAPAAFLAGLRRFELGDVPRPEPRAGEVLVELSAVGICGSDLHYFRIGRIGSQVVDFPAILGHEPAGAVVDVGKGVTRLRPGDRVALEPGIACGRCRYCRAGRANLCTAVKFLGSPGFTGAFQRFLVMPEACAEKLPPAVDAALGCATEPLGVALHGMNLVALAPHDRVGVIGGGPIGLAVAALARARGARVELLSDPRPLRRAIARKLGVARAVEPAAFVEAARAVTEGQGLDAVFECAGAPEAFDQSVAACCRGARLALLGIAEVDLVHIDPHEWRRRELLVIPARRSNQTLPAVLAQLAAGDLGLRAAGYFSNTVGLAGLQSAFERLEDRAEPEVKVIVDPRQ
ncbi:MAG: alcohol dehydrogenase catalytic domain-containing protein [Planctomycetota bacterium]|nr:alcohol dehydrogenase catalytic domain-containing protein [Planctomycetota bacterium]